MEAYHMYADTLFLTMVGIGMTLLVITAAVAG
jgi:hypothetical protein